MSSANKEQKEEQKPTDEERAASVRYALIGIVISLALVWFLGQVVLDLEEQKTLLWRVGRILGVALFGWTGYSIGLGKGRVVAENLECLAIAVVMALVLKHFLIEAYKIPTGSMQPTILGNDRTGIFDRVLVNKFAYLVDDPERYEVIVFKYPLDRSKNYIKRLIGLPGERVMIFNGNIYTATKGEDGEYGPLTIARKPQAVRDSVLKDIFSSGLPGEGFDEKFELLAGNHRIEGDTIILDPDSKFRYGHGDATRDRYLDGYDPDWGIESPYGSVEFGSENVPDLVLGGSIEPQEGCQEVRLIIFVDGVEHRAVLGVGEGAGSWLESGIRSNQGDRLQPIVGDSPVVAENEGLRLTPGQATDVVFYHVDQELILQIDGDPELRFAYEIEPLTGPAIEGEAFPVPHTSENDLEFEVRGGGAVVQDLLVQRDIHYLTTGGGRTQLFEIPDDCLLALGDNTQNSYDGRMWSAQAVKLADGTEVLREDKEQGYDTRMFIDIYGESYRTPGRNARTVHRVKGNRYSFVPTNLLLGKAIAVFWPIYPHFRWKLIR